MEFETRVQNIPCVCKVTYYGKYIPATHFEPHEPEEMEFELYNFSGSRMKWLEYKVTDRDYNNLLIEYRELCEETAAEYACAY